MRIIVDEVPQHPDDCMFSDFVRLVDPEYMKELEESGELEVCEDCGGIVLDDGRTKESYMCTLKDDICGFEICGFESCGECDCLAAMQKSISWI